MIFKQPGSFRTRVYSKDDIKCLYNLYGIPFRSWHKQDVIGRQSGGQDKGKHRNALC